MNNYNYRSNKPKTSPEEPMMLRMLHPTSGQQGFNAVNNQPGFPSSGSVDPRLAMRINMQAQQAIASSQMYTGNPYQGAAMPMYSPSMYGIYQPYPNFARRS